MAQRKDANEIHRKISQQQAGVKGTFCHDVGVAGVDSELHPGKSHTRAWFTTTHWSVIIAARDVASPASTAALERLCRAYWPPVYSFIRREGFGPDDAKELTQEFLSRLVHKEWLNHLKHQDGKFRTFLLTVLKNFLSDERDRAKAQKTQLPTTSEITVKMDRLGQMEQSGWLPAPQTPK